MKSNYSVEPLLNSEKLSWKIILPRFLYKLAIAFWMLTLYCLKVFIVVVLATLAFERLYHVELSIDNVISVYITFLLIDLLVKPFLVLIYNKDYFLVEYEIGEVHVVREIKQNKEKLDIDKPSIKIVYRLVRKHCYGNVWNRFAEISDIFDPTTYYLYDSDGECFQRLTIYSNKKE